MLLLALPFTTGLSTVLTVIALPALTILTALTPSTLPTVFSRNGALFQYILSTY